MDRYQALTRMCLNNWHYISRKVLSFHPDITAGNTASCLHRLVEYLLFFINLLANSCIV